MANSSNTVNSGGGAVFSGDITAGRDVVINHFTEIRQVTEHLYDRCTAAGGGSDGFLGRLDNLQWIAGIVEEGAKELQTDISAQDPQLQRVYHECVSVLSDIQTLASQVHDSSSVPVDMAKGLDISWEERLDKARSRLMTLQMKLSHIRNKKIAQDVDIIKAAVAKMLDDPSETDDTSTIKTFYTASSVPYVERQTWRELERILRGQFSTEFLRDNFALIVTAVEETLFDYTAAAPTEDVRLSLDTRVNSIITAQSSGDTVSSNTQPTLNNERSALSQHEQIDPRKDAAIEENDPLPFYDAARQFQIRTRRPIETSVRGVHGFDHDDRGKLWAERVDDFKHERLLTFDGGGVKSYSSVLIMRRLMLEIARYEALFEEVFTHYPRRFDTSDFRPCHYFDKMYGTSTGGIIAIALGRLRMSVEDTIHAFPKLLDAMYSHVRSVIPLHTKYYHKPLEKAVMHMSKEHNKETSSGDTFPWLIVGNHEDTLCQTICLTATHNGQPGEPHLLRTYNHTYDEMTPPWVTPYNEGTDDLKIWQVARATTATPFHFDMLVASPHEGQGPMGFKDGGIRENNPSWCAYSENAALNGDEIEPSVLLSIGAGKPKSGQPVFESIWPGALGSLPALQRYSEKFAVFKNLLIKELEGGDRHKTMRTIARGEQRWYKRLSVNRGLEDMKMDQWESGFNNSTQWKTVGGRTLTKIDLATSLYLDRDHADTVDGIREYQPPKIMIDHIAEKLVRARRARELEAMTTRGEIRERWEAYMGKHLPGEQEFYKEYLAQWDYALLGRK